MALHFYRVSRGWGSTDRPLLPRRVWYFGGVAIAGERPETGVRIMLERDGAKNDPPWNYRGAAHVPDASYPCSVEVSAAGEVTVGLASGPSDLPEKIRLIVRAVYRQADGDAPAWRIVRWRADK